MTFGISRVHGSLIAPKNFAGVTLQDFTLTFWSGNYTSAWRDWNGGQGTTDGALDKVFRTAVETIGTVSRVGTLNTATGALHFALEVLGGDLDSDAYLGMGLPGSSATTHAALTAAVVALGDMSFWCNTGTSAAYYATVNLTSATVGTFTY
jgi:hypothetical protein